jgi:hypothetical protein
MIPPPSTMSGTRRSCNRIASKISWIGNGEYESNFRYPSSYVRRAAATSAVGVSNSAMTP